MKKIKKIYLFIALLLVLAGVIFVLSQKEEWLVYENSRYHFTVAYPPDWKISGASTNNDGREFISGNEQIICHVYGFFNALTGEDGNPQTLDEFVVWLGDDPIYETLETKGAKLAGKKAMLLLRQTKEGRIQQGVYTLSEDVGYGLVCNYPDFKAKDSFKKGFKRMMGSFEVTAAAMSQFGSEPPVCANLTNGVLAPLKDKQTFLDEDYPEVAITDRASWNREKLPERVTDLEGSGYNCYPMPFDLGDTKQLPGMHIEPEVKSVEWSCETEYEDFQYLSQDLENEKKNLENQGYLCEQQKCLENEELIFIWLCVK